MSENHVTAYSVAVLYNNIDKNESYFNFFCVNLLPEIYCWKIQEYQNCWIRTMKIKILNKLALNIDLALENIFNCINVINNSNWRNVIKKFSVDILIQYIWSLRKFSWAHNICTYIKKHSIFVFNMINVARLKVNKYHIKII